MGQKELTMVMSQIRGGIAGSDPRKISQRGAWIVLKQVHNLPSKGACLRLKVTIYPRKMEIFIPKSENIYPSSDHLV